MTNETVLGILDTLERRDTFLIGRLEMEALNSFLKEEDSRAFTSAHSFDMSWGIELHENRTKSNFSLNGFNQCESLSIALL